LQKAVPLDFVFGDNNYEKYKEYVQNFLNEKLLSKEMFEKVQNHMKKHFMHRRIAP